MKMAALILVAAFGLGCGEMKDEDAPMPTCASTVRTIICPVGSPTQRACMGIEAACQLPDGNACEPACRR